MEDIIKPVLEKEIRTNIPYLNGGQTPIREILRGIIQLKILEQIKIKKRRREYFFYSFDYSPKNFTPSNCRNIL